MLCAAVAAVALERVAAVAGDLHLWADGVWHLLEVAAGKWFFVWVWSLWGDLFRSRILALVVLQAPTVLAIQLGVSSLPALSKVFGLSLYSHALVSLWLCYRYAPRRRYLLFPLLSLFAGSMNAEGYIINDSHFLVSVYWPVLFLLLFKPDPALGGRLLLLILSFLTLLSYESMLFFGPVLAGVCAWRIRATERGRGLTIGLAVWYLLGAMLAAASVAWPHDPANRAAFIHGLVEVLQSNHLPAKVSIIVLLASAVLLGVPPGRVKLQRITFGVGLVAVGFMTAQAVLGHGVTDLVLQVPARTLNVLAPLGATALLLAVFFGWFKPSRTALGLTAILVGALGCAQALWSVGYLVRWRTVIAVVRQEVSRHEGPIALKDSALSRRWGTLHLNRLYVAWSLLPLSLYEAPGGRVQAVIVPDRDSYLAFDPFQPPTFPDLSAYGVRYDRYQAALSRDRRYIVGQILTFAEGGSAEPFLGTGWSAGERWGRWCAARECAIRLPLAKAAANEVVLQALVVPDLGSTPSDMMVEVLVNDRPVAEWSFEGSTNDVRLMQARISSTVLAHSDPVSVRLRIRERAPPRTGSEQQAPRLGFTKMRLHPEGH